MLNNKYKLQKTGLDFIKIYLSMSLWNKLLLLVLVLACLLEQVMAKAKKSSKAPQKSKKPAPKKGKKSRRDEDS